jgi:hypothetical protein
MRKMFTIKSIAVDHFRIPLPLASADSTHGEIAHFCLIAGRLTDARGREGRDYTYIVDNIAAAAIRKLIGQDLAKSILASAQFLLKAFVRRCAGTSIL